MNPDRLATIAEVATYLRKNERTLRRWIKAGEGPTPILVGGEYRYRPAEVEAWLRSQEVRPAA